jgi:SMC domain protein
MKIASFSIQIFRCIKDLNVDCLDDKGKVRQWTVLLGENNSGKTNVLRALALLEMEKYEFSVGPVTGKDIALYAPLAVKHKDQFVGQENPAVKADLLADSGEKFSWQYTEQRVSAEPLESPNRLSVFAYGVSRYPAHTALNERESKPYQTLFSTEARLSDFQEWLLQLDYSQKSGSEKSQKRLEKMHDLVKSDLFPGVTDFSFKKDGDNERVVVVFSAGKDGDVRFEELGFGYQTSLTWLADFCKRMFELYPDADNPLHEEAVVLVDEIDLHLHPKWQRDLVPTLSKIFPNVQFIVTTHSPHVLQSMEDVNLYVLRRNAESGEIEAERSNVTNFTGWTVEEILGVTMELGDDVLSVAYNAVKKDFEEALRNKDRAAAQRYYERLDEMMRPGNPMRSIYRIRLEEMA